MREGLLMKPSTVKAKAESEINSCNISPQNWKDTSSVKWKQFSRQRTGGWGTKCNKSLLSLQKVTGVWDYEEKTRQNWVMTIKTEVNEAWRTTSVLTLTGTRGQLETVGSVTSALPLHSWLDKLQQEDSVSGTDYWKQNKTKTYLTVANMAEWSLTLSAAPVILLSAV